MHRDFVAKSDLRKYIKIVIRRKFILIFSTLVIFSLSVLGIFLSKPVYQASTKVLIKTPEGLGLISDDVNMVDKSIRPIRSRILSYVYLKKVVERLNMVKSLREKFAVGKFAEAPREMIERLIINNLQQRRLRVIPKGKFLFEIRAQHEDPKLAMDLANNVAQVFIEESFRDEQAGLNALFSFISEQLEKYKNRLLDAEDKLTEYKMKNIVPKEISRSNKKINEYESQKAKLEINLRALNIELDNLRKVILESDSRILDYYVNNVQSFKGLRVPDIETKIEELKFTLENLLTKYTRSYPAVIEVQRRINGLQEKLLNEVKLGIQKKINSYQKELERSKLIMKDLDAKIEEYNKQLMSLPAQEVEYVRLLRYKETSENIYKLFMKKMEDTEIAKASDQKKIRIPYKIIDPALLPLVPVKPNKKKILIMGLFLGFGVGFAWIFLLEFFDSSLKDVEDIAHMVKAPNLGVIPLIGLGKGQAPEIDNLYDRESNYLTEFIRLYKNIEVLGTPQVILFTSSLKSEGKSLLISSLALTAIRMQQEPVLLIDSDLRGGRLHRIFKTPNEVGLSDILTGQAKLDEAVKETKYPNLKLITVGTRNKNPGEFVESPAYAKLIRELRTKYRYILIDAPPVLPVNDAISISRHADGVIYIVLAGETPLEVIKRGLGILEQAQTKVFGTVVNNKKEVLNDAGYGYDYAYPYE